MVLKSRNGTVAMPTNFNPVTSQFLSPWYKKRRFRKLTSSKKKKVATLIFEYIYIIYMRVCTVETLLVMQALVVKQKSIAKAV